MNAHMNESTWLLQHSKNVFSQSGEDGIIEKALSLLSDHDHWCVEFGAWDGQYLSNTSNLMKNHNYRTVLIEGDKYKYQELKRTYKNQERVYTLNAYVGFNTADGLDALLKDIPIPVNFDFLSIDIDGNDYHVWAGIANYQPKLICIEFNPTIPTEVDFVQPAHFTLNQGSSLSALTRLGKEKGYELVCVLPFNAVFVRSEYFPVFKIANNTPEALRTDLSYITYIFTGYDGRTFLRGNLSLPWHGVNYRESAAQQIPRVFQHFPGNFSKLKMKLFHFWKNLRRVLTTK
jgi:hypothetical protein